MDLCEFADSCVFYKGTQSNLPDNADQLKEDYCNKNSLHCARYMVFQALGTDNVPGDLLPTEKDKAYLKIAGA